MTVRFQLRITMGREHLAVGINKYAFSLGLFKELFKVLQIVPGNQYGLPFFVAQRDFCWYRMAKDACVSGIEKLHRFKGSLAAPERQADPIVQT